MAASTRLKKMLPPPMRSRRLVTGCTSAAMVLPLMWVLPGQVMLPESALTRDTAMQAAQHSAAPDADRIRHAIVHVSGSAGRASAGRGAVSAKTPDRDIPQVALVAYRRAAGVIDSVDDRCGLSWAVLAAIGKVESDHGRYRGSRLDGRGVERPGLLGPVLDGERGFAAVHDTDAGTLDHNRRWDRAVGPMQLLPATWRVVAVDGDGDGVRNPQDIDDAALAAAVYLCSGHRSLASDAGVRAAALRYNHSRHYASLILHYTRLYSGLDDYPVMPLGGPRGWTGSAPTGVPREHPDVRTGPRQHAGQSKHAGTFGDHDDSTAGYGRDDHATSDQPPASGSDGPSAGASDGPSGPTSTPTEDPGDPGDAPTTAPTAGTITGTWGRCPQGYCVGSAILSVPVTTTAQAPGDLDDDGTVETWGEELAGLVGHRVTITGRASEAAYVVATINGVSVDAAPATPTPTPSPTATPTPDPSAPAQSTSADAGSTAAG